MKTLIKTTLLILVAFSLNQCGKIDGSHFYKNYVQSYSNPASFSIEKGSYRVISKLIGEGILVRQKTGVILNSGDIGYEKIALANNDTRFNRRLEIGYARDFRAHNVSINPIESISIISDTDFDAEHPAGTSLNDIFDIVYVDVIPIINNGYKGKVPTRMTLTEFNQTRRTFIELEFLLIPTKSPLTNSNHRLSMTYKQTLGGTITSTSEPMTISIGN